ncbi:hypothetical protein BH24ACT11_BH24ACT11_19300 [soil metagenome]
MVAGVRGPAVLHLLLYGAPMAHRHPSRLDELDEGLDVRPQFSREGETVDIPRRKISQTSVAPETAYQIIRD